MVREDLEIFDARIRKLGTDLFARLPDWIQQATALAG